MLLTRKTAGSLSVPLALLAGLSVASSASATDRRFPFTYETGVLGPGQAEIEPWTTFRVGREHYYSRIDQRLEFELGLVRNLQTALYWNFERVTADARDPVTGELVRSSEFTLASISSEWKYKLSDPLADTFGSALYLEGAYGPDEAELEAKLLFDKQVGNFLVALNLVGEQEWEFSAGETESEQKLVLNLAAGYFLTNELVLGAEIESATLIEEGSMESSVIYAGPSLAYASGRYWAAVGVTPQVFAPKTEEGRLDLEHNEYLRARILLGFHL
jgi:hypothetical protein